MRAPLSIASSACLKSRFIARSSPFGPSAAGKSSGRTRERSLPFRAALNRASSALSMNGELISTRLAFSGRGSRRSPSGPTSELTEVTISSRMASSGGLVTCAKSCLK